MILTVGMSPCVDVTVRLEQFKLGKTNVASGKSVTYAGKANNVAVGVTRLGGAAFVTGFMYNENGSLFEKALDKEGIPFSFIWNPGRVRENYKFIDENGRLTEVNEEGREVAGEKRRDHLDFVRIQAAKSEAAVISGGAYSNQLLELTNGNANGMVTSQPFFLTDTDEALMGFAAEYKERCGLDIGIMTLCAYDGMKLIADAAIRSGAATRAELRDAVADTKGFIGLGGKITFDQYGANHRKYQIIGIENNQFVLLENADYMADFIPPDIGK